jgi:hypothetical protein
MPSLTAPAGAPSASETPTMRRIDKPALDRSGSATQGGEANSPELANTFQDFSTVFDDGLGIVDLSAISGSSSVATRYITRTCLVKQKLMMTVLLVRLLISPLPRFLTLALTPC